MPDSVFIKNIFDYDISFEDKVWTVWQYQYKNNSVYRNWCNALDRRNISALNDIPFLPISFFKTHKVISGADNVDIIFESSGTTQSFTSKHYVHDTELYEKSFMRAFEIFYGKPEEWCIIGLLPSYLERKNSSLVYMADALIKKSNHNLSGFYLYDFESLYTALQQLEASGQKTLLIGVTFALLGFAEAYPMKLRHITIMETGGMKGKREELTRAQVHEILCKRLGASVIHSEYGMTELLSQAYSKDEGKFYCPPWMKVLVRDEDGPLQVNTTGRGALNIIDLANIHSCSFIGTDDVGIVHKDGSFEVHGRLDDSDMRGCSLMVLQK